MFEKREPLSKYITPDLMKNWKEHVLPEIELEHESNTVTMHNMSTRTITTEEKNFQKIENEIISTVFADRIWTDICTSNNLDPDDYTYKLETEAIDYFRSML